MKSRSRVTLFSEGDDGAHVFNVRNGAVRLPQLLSDRRRQILGFVPPGDFLVLSLQDHYDFRTARAKRRRIRVETREGRCGLRSVLPGFDPRPFLTLPYDVIESESIDHGGRLI